MFEQEAKGLTFLAEQRIFRVPSVIAFGATEDQQWLILEWVENGLPTKKFWKSFGECLAKLHLVSSDFFGLDTDNYMGALKQSNKKTAKWDQFFMTERLQPQVQLAMEKGFLENEQIIHFERLYQKLGEIFPSTKSSLLHGDLWSGNFICDQNSQPVLIDPAIYFGHPAMDTGMTELFGGFDKAFYQAYASHYPLISPFAEQRELCRLYPLLIHLNLFGLAYLPAIKKTIARF
jgi:protein-ribulosamine 3-kinase